MVHTWGAARGDVRSAARAGRFRVQDVLQAAQTCVDAAHDVTAMAQSIKRQIADQ